MLDFADLRVLASLNREIRKWVFPSDDSPFHLREWLKYQECDEDLKQWYLTHRELNKVSLTELQLKDEFITELSYPPDFDKNSHQELFDSFWEEEGLGGSIIDSPYSDLKNNLKA